jgi:hypothetical protein
MLSDHAALYEPIRRQCGCTASRRKLIEREPGHSPYQYGHDSDRNDDSEDLAALHAKALPARA